MSQSPPGPSPAPVAVPLLPQVEGYEVLEEVGRGGMGVVYRAWQKSLERTVALKMILSGAFATEADIERFRTEAIAVARLNHPNLLSIYEIGYQDGLPFFSMEYLEGGNLARFLRGRPQSPFVAAQLVQKLAEAMAYAHQQGVIHRDLKPANILFQSQESGVRGHESGGRGEESGARSQESGDGQEAGPAWMLSLNRLTPKITDFGLAKELHRDQLLTRTGDILGTPQYMAPEQAAGRNEEVGPRTDIYSLGTILYELITARPLFGDVSPAEALLKVAQEEPPPPRRIVRDIPADLETICVKCLEKSPAKRYQSARELADDLGRFLAGETIQARKPSLIRRAGKWLRRHPAKVVLAVATTVIVALGIAWGTELWRRARVEQEAQKTAQVEREKAAQLERDKTLLETERMLAEALLDRGLFMAERGDRARGLHWMTRSLEIVARVEEKQEKTLPLSAAIRRNLASWSHHFFGRAVLLPHKGGVRSVAFSADGKFAATAGKDNVAQVWDGYSGKKVGPPLAHVGPVWGVAFGPQGRFLFTVSGDHKRSELRVYAATGDPDEPYRLRGKPAFLASEPRKLALDPDGRRLLVTFLEPDCCLFHFTPEAADSGLTLAGLIRHKSGLKAALFADAGQTIVTIAADRKIGRWSAADRKPLGELIDFPGYPEALALRGDGKVLAVGGSFNAAFVGGFPVKPSLLGPLPEESKASKGVVVLLDVDKGGRLGPPMFHPGVIKSLAFSPDGRVLASSSAFFDAEKKLQGYVRLHHADLRHAQLGKQMGRELPHAKNVWALAFSGDGRVLLTGCEDRTARFWNVEEQTPLGPPLLHEGFVVDAAIHPKLSLALTAGDNGAARLSDVPNQPAWAPPLPLPPLDEKTPNSAAHGVAWEADGEHVWTSGSRGGVFRWHARSGKLIDQLPLKLDDEALDLVMLPRENALLALCGGVVHRWNIEQRRVTFSVRPLRPDGEVVLATAADDDSFFVASKVHGVVQKYSCATGERLGPELTIEGSLQSMAASRDGTRIATSSYFPKENRSRVAVRDAALNIIQQWEHLSLIPALAFSPDGKLLATGGDDKLAQLWNIDTGKLHIAPLVLENTVEFLSFSPDGKLLASSCTRGPTRVWDLGSGRPQGNVILPTHAVRRVAFRPDGKVLAIASETDGKAYYEHVPPAVEGSVKHLRLWIEVLTGMELTDSDVVLPLAPAALAERREQLRALGGPPYRPKVDE